MKANQSKGIYLKPKIILKQVEVKQLVSESGWPEKKAKYKKVKLIFNHKTTFRLQE